MNFYHYFMLSMDQGQISDEVTKCTNNATLAILLVDTSRKLISEKQYRRQFSITTYTISSEENWCFRNERRLGHLSKIS